MADPCDSSCLYMRRLNEMIAFCPSPAILDMEVALFRRLQAFEVEARAGGAPGGSLDAIAAARSSMTLAASRHWLPVTRGH
ncbi:hypothetical protein [Methylobacterium gnaphalii]|nr:hypothetical protein [Methylobacterium gnaphalii]